MNRCVKHRATLNVDLVSYREYLVHVFPAVPFFPGFPYFFAEYLVHVFPELQ